MKIDKAGDSPFDANDPLGELLNAAASPAPDGDLARSLLAIERRSAAAVVLSAGIEKWFYLNQTKIESVQRYLTLVGREQTYKLLMAGNWLTIRQSGLEMKVPKFDSKEGESTSYTGHNPKLEFVESLAEQLIQHGRNAEEFVDDLPGSFKKIYDDALTDLKQRTEREQRASKTSIPESER